jgi:putative heme-binding domain-containing protein
MAAMTWRLFPAVVVLWVIGWAVPSAPTFAKASTSAEASVDKTVGEQTTPGKNPFEGNPEAIQAGMGGYRLRCADCHGTDGRGVRGPDITQVWNSGRTDQGLFNTIRRGVPNSEMPAFVAPRTSDREVWQMLAYLRTLAAPAAPEPPRGNAENGAKVFRALCANCHKADGTGGRLGPDLSRIGTARTRDVLLARIRRGSEEFRAGFEPVTVTPADGAPIQGVKKNEDLFSVQIMDTRERIQGYEKDKVAAVENGRTSAMPVFGPDRLTDSDLDDLLRYLQTLRGFNPAVKQ